MSLIRAVDCAFPRSSYPSWAVVVCGYVGGDTPHIWSTGEVQTVRAAGQTWWGIWTSRNGSTTRLTMDDGRVDAAGMIANLPKYGYSKSSPVFYDVEPGVFDNDPIGARLAIAKWKLDMKAAGYLLAYSYTVERQGGDWIANPTGVQPTSLPPGKIGVQYGQSDEQPNPFFDYNVFDSTLLQGSADMQLTQADADLVVSTLLSRRMDDVGFAAPLKLVLANTLKTSTAASELGSHLATALVPPLVAALTPLIQPVPQAEIEAALRAVLNSITFPPVV